MWQAQTNPCYYCRQLSKLTNTSKESNGERNPHTLDTDLESETRAQVKEIGGTSSSDVSKKLDLNTPPSIMAPPRPDSVASQHAAVAIVTNGIVLPTEGAKETKINEPPKPNHLLDHGLISFRGIELLRMVCLYLTFYHRLSIGK